MFSKQFYLEIIKPFLRIKIEKNMRPISMLITFSKIIKKIIKLRLI